MQTRRASGKREAASEAQLTMITAASIIFLWALVALGARPYRVAPPLPPCEEVLPPTAATIYAGDLLQDCELTFCVVDRRRFK